MLLQLKDKQLHIVSLCKEVKTVALFKEKKSPVAAKNLKTFHCFACPGQQGGKKNTKQQNKTKNSHKLQTTKSTATSCYYSQIYSGRLFLLTNKVLRRRKRFQKAKDELAIKGIDHFHFADLHKVLKPHGSAAEETVTDWSC